MIVPSDLTKLLIERISQTPSYFADEYAKAIERLRNAGNQEDGYYIVSDQATMDVLLDSGFIQDETGTEYEDPTEIREMAWDMLVLADLAELAQKPKKKPRPVRKRRKQK